MIMKEAARVALEAEKAAKKEVPAPKKEVEATPAKEVNKLTK